MDISSNRTTNISYISTLVYTTSSQSTTMDINVTEMTSSLTKEELLTNTLGPRSQDLWSAVILMTIYLLIFISGTLGNVCTCIVIVKNNYMQTATNYYLFSLAISDVMTLVLALPQEAYSIWEAYPWRFGKAYCYIKALLWEMTSYASVLTITAFTIERYVAICHPLKAHAFANLSRCIKIIVAIWIVSLICALPYPLHTELFYFIDAGTNNVTRVEDSLICNIPKKYYKRMKYIFQLSTLLFFVIPMTLIVVIYILIALTLRQAALQRVESQESSYKITQGAPVSTSGTAVFRMLVAVVVAFFACWAPFHAQRLLTIYNTDWTPLLLHIQSTLFYISGVLYFVGSTVNPILYNVMSKRYREAFKDTICNCRRKRTACVRGSTVHQSFYFNKIGRAPVRHALSRQAMSMDEAGSGSRSDEALEARRSLTLNGNGALRESLRAQLIEEMGKLNEQTYDENKSWTDNRNRQADYTAYSACTEEPREVTPVSPSSDLQILLSNASSAESAC